MRRLSLVSRAAVRVCVPRLLKAAVVVLPLVQAFLRNPKRVAQLRRMVTPWIYLRQGRDERPTCSRTHTWIPTTDSAAALLRICLRRIAYRLDIEDVAIDPEPSGVGHDLGARDTALVEHQN